MNILFYHYDECCPTKGGIQRTTALLARGFSKLHGYSCFHSYSYKDPYPKSVPRASFFEKTFYIDFEQTDIAKIIEEYSIDTIINQMGVYENRFFRDAIDRSEYPCKLIYCHHTTPLREPDLTRKGVVKSKSRIKRVCKHLLLPIFRIRCKYLNRKFRKIEYRNIMHDSDKVVLLSRNYMQEWNSLTNNLYSEKLDAIPNALSFSHYLDDTMIWEKKKRLLVVGRMEDFPKRVSKILKLWRKIAKYDDLNDWELDIVGDGTDLESYRNYVSAKCIPRVNFHGRAESEPFYLEDSIFVMMSDREGFPMVLCEAQQSGCVPIAYSSFASIYDVISDGQSGILIPPFNERMFHEKLLSLMRNRSYREIMAQKCVESSKKNSLDHVVSKWDSLLSRM